MLASFLSFISSIFFLFPAPSTIISPSNRQPVLFTPPPPLPTLPLATPSFASPLILLLNISYPLAPISTNPFRFDLDTAISSSLSGLSFGSFCPNTTSFPFLRFSGDNPYSPGWEAYTLDLLSVPSNTNDVLFIFLSWISSALDFDVPVNISATLSNGSTILQQSNISISAGFRPNFDFGISNGVFCASNLVPPAASLRLVSLNSFPFFQLIEEELLTSPEPSEEFLPDFSIEPTPDFIFSSTAPDLTDDFPLLSDDVALFVNFTYQSTITDVESGLDFLGTQFGANCGNTPSEFVFYSGNDFSPVGQERFGVDVSEARQQGLWTGQTLIILTADWWSTFDPLGEVIVSIALVGPTGVIQQDEFPVFPGESTSCFHRPVAEVLILNNPITNKYSFTVSTELMPSPDLFEESPGPSPEDFVEPSLEPFIPIVSSSVVLFVQFAWDSSDSTTPSDIEASVDYLSNSIGAGCGDSSPFVQFSGNSFSSVGTETFLIDVEDAFNSVGNEALDVGLGAGWFGVFPTNATANVSVGLVGSDGQIGKTTTVDVFPTRWNGCPGREVGRVKVVNEGSFAFEVTAAGPPSIDNAFPDLEGEQWLRVNFGNNQGLGGGLSLGGDVVGRDCSFGFNGAGLVVRSTLGIGEGELYAARVGEMMRRGLWEDFVDVSLMGITEGGSGTVVVDLIDENGEILDSQSGGFGGSPNSDLFLTSCRNKVGRVRLLSENNSTLSMQLSVY